MVILPTDPQTFVVWGFRRFYGKLETMNVYDEIVKDYPYSTFKFTSAITSQPDAMGGAVAVSQRTRTNLVTNPGAEGSTGFLSNNGTIWTVSSDTTVKQGGTQSKKSTPVTYGASGALLSMYNVAVAAAVPATAGTVYTISAYFAHNAAVSSNAQIGIAFFDASSASTGSALSVNTSIVGGSVFTRVSVTATAPAGTTKMYPTATVSRSSGVTVAGEAAWIDSVLVEATPDLRPYFDGSTPGASWSGTVNASSSTMIEATPISDLSMVSGPTKSLLLGSDFAIRFPMPDRFSKEYTSLPFSIEAWVGFDTNGSIPIMSHINSPDGLYFDGNYLIFAVDLDGGGNISAKWPTPDFTKNYHVVGVYNTQKVMLYVDGALVASTDMPLGAVIALKSDKNLYGGITAQRTMRLEAPAIHYRELVAERIAAHYAAGRMVMDTLDAVGMFGGALWKFSDERRDIMYAKDVDWTTDGLVDNVITSATLEPNYDSTDLSIAGTYTIPVPISDILSTSPVVPQGMKVEWDGDGTFTVQYSLNNGSTWTTAVNGQVQANTVGMATTIVPQIKISFPAGAARGTNVVRYMRVTAYKTYTSYSVNSNERTVTLNAYTPTSTNWSEPIETDNAVGTIVGSTNTYTLNESIETDFTNIGTIEFWAEFTGNILGYYLLDSRGVTPSNASYIWVAGTGQLSWSGFSAVYVDGVSVSNSTFVPIVGRPYHIVGVYTAPHNAKVRVQTAVTGVTNQIPMMAVYPGSLTAAQVLSLFNAYFGYPVLAAEDANVITVLETAPASKAYVNDWSIQGAG